ncbi:hypothetical protein MuYL_2686 [Mucilaginibacter xinganensis]|uniref:Uncharacterized protein n=1 Tax=Mucilaginibacter xinganensis TaxID=1234841 RepID=A0A223NXH3_9SPHI|nr:hypothetical protein MuYL_2686 [Mucilaginibacter xinganensis]
MQLRIIAEINLIWPQHAGQIRIMLFSILFIMQPVLPLFTVFYTVI